MRRLSCSTSAGRFITVLFMAAMLVAGFTSCGRLKGQFAFRFPPDDQYRLVPRDIELPDNAAMDWVFMFKSIKNRTRVGVILEKKELVPVEVMSCEEIASTEIPAVYGSVKDLAPGSYRLILTDIAGNNALIAEREFVVYSTGEEEELPLD